MSRQFAAPASWRNAVSRGRHLKWCTAPPSVAEYAIPVRESAHRQDLV